MCTSVKHHRLKHRPDHSGFTLVEMLVAVALVMLMMSMFVTIFQMATGSATKQRIIAESDQRSRQLTTILRSDFAKRSFRNSFPFLPNEDPTLTKVPFSARTGYVYISCNNTTSGLDDMIQFTVDARMTQTNPDSSPYYGAAASLFDNIYGTVDGSNPSLPFSPNQPEADDGELSPNGTSSSDAAEISLFLRGGNLIRRIMLIREPLPVAGSDLETQPKSSRGNPFFLTNVAGGTFHRAAAPTVAEDNFWQYFDFSAVPSNWANLRNGTDTIPSGVLFVGIDALANDQPSPMALGMPRFRFGFNPLTDLSREHEGTAASALFMGRYLQAETSYADFNWPIAPSVAIANGNPLDVTQTVSINSTANLVTVFQGPIERGGPRRVEDVLMSNVREFKIELWDSKLERWVVPGHSAVRPYVDGGGTVRTLAGDYHIVRNMQYDSIANAITYGPLQIPGVLAGVPHVFDTWHPQISRDANGNSLNDISESQAPYTPLKYYPPRQIDTPPGPSSPSMPPPSSEFDPYASLPRVGTNRGYWTSGTSYQKDDVVFANNLTPGWDAPQVAPPLPPDGIFNWITDKADIPAESVHIAYRCVGVTNGSTSPPTGTSGVGVPPWQSPGLRFLDNDLLWEGFQNYQPLKSVRLTISFIEPNSETPKQLTLILPLTDESR